MTSPPPLMASLAEHRLAAGVTVCAVADALGVHASMVSGWQAGRRSPSWRYALAYAAAVGRQVVVWRDGILALGVDVPQVLPRLREDAGLTQSALAARMGMTRGVVSLAETDRGHTLVTVERYVTALGAELRHLPLEAP